MAIIVDKVQKRRDIALACVELFTQSGINDLSIAKVAKTAGVGKGTIYEYFQNKNDIVFEILNILMSEHNEIKKKKLLSMDSTKEKVKVFFSFFYNEEDVKLREMYKEFTSILLTNPNDEMLEFQTECYYLYNNWINRIIDEGIKKGELFEHAKELIMGLFAFAQGMFLMSATTNAVGDLQKQINTQIDILFELIEVKK